MRHKVMLNVTPLLQYVHRYTPHTLGEVEKVVLTKVPDVTVCPRRLQPNEVW